MAPKRSLMPPPRHSLLGAIHKGRHALEGGEGVVLNVIIVLIGCVNGTVTRGGGSKNVRNLHDIIYGGSPRGSDAAAASEIF